jgi:hypothetical protein
MADKSKTTEERIAELTENVANMEQRLQVVSEFAAILAAVICNRKAIDEDDVEGILRSLKPAPNLTHAQRQQSAAAGFEVEHLTGEFRGARSRGL